MSKKLTDTVLRVGPARLSYMNAFKPRMNTLKKKLEYSVVPMIDKTDKVTVELVKAAEKAALLAKFKEVPKKFASVLRDGDDETDNEGEPKYPGHYFIAAHESEENPPILLDKFGEPADPNDWVSGDWGNVKIAFSAYEFEGKRGVSAYLKAIQFTKKDEPFGAGKQTLESVKSDFDLAEEEEDYLK